MVFLHFKTMNMSMQKNLAEDTLLSLKKEAQEELKYEKIKLYGTEYTTLLTKKFKNKKPWSKPDNNLLTAFIPGTIVEMFVAEKQQVLKGQKLMILEAMKMQNIIIAPCNCSIKKIDITVGERVPKGKVILQFEPSNPYN